MTVSVDQLETLAWASGPLVVLGLAWQAFRYRVPPELVAIVATMGLPLAGLWRPDLLPYAIAPGQWLWLGALLVVSLAATRKLELRSKLDVVLLGMLAGALPAALLAARAARDPRSAGQLAVIAAGGAALSPLGGPVQWMLAGPTLDWWLASAPAGLAAIAASWNGADLGDDAPEPLPTAVRVRWFVAVMWIGCLVQIGGAPWAISALTESPPVNVPIWLWTLAAWAAGNLVDPWIVADLGGRATALGAEGEGLNAAVVGLSLPNLAVLVMAWHGSNWRAVPWGLPGVIAGVIVALLLV
ncbi:MAG: hypothetical protein EP330_18680 [Deltaproteobacteria bacterium]|nr:MAG: hypothetical protein EP330_18680 [Deltaproteobacteria bacterium]